jgi:hypothetical protein
VGPRGVGGYLQRNGKYVHGPRKEAYTVSSLVTHTNEVTHDLFGDLTTESDGCSLSPNMPVMATPAAVAAGVAITAAAFGVGYAVEEAGDG